MVCFIRFNQLKIETVISSSPLCFILSKNHLIAMQSAHLDFPLSFLFAIMTSFLDMYYRYVFHILNNKSAFFFVICGNYFLPFVGVIGFKNNDVLEVETVHNDLCVAILFTNATPLIFLLCFFTN